MQSWTLFPLLSPFRFKLLSQEEGEYFNVPVPPEGSEGNEELRQKFEVRVSPSFLPAFLPSMETDKSTTVLLSCLWCGISGDFLRL
jgi:hypothetical protein